MLQFGLVRGLHFCAFKTDIQIFILSNEQIQKQNAFNKCNGQATIRPEIKFVVSGCEPSMRRCAPLSFTLAWYDLGMFPTSCSCRFSYLHLFVSRYYRHTR